jgi:YesN/AraC family two-component response regulator
MAQVISVLYFANAFTNLPFFLYLHMLVSIIIIVYLVYYELMERIIPPEKSELSAVEKALLAAREPLDGDLWPQICQAMDKWEIWRDPNTTVETLCADIGTNRIYAANSIREHTGLTFNDYLNKKRIDFMADQLRSNPTLDQKALYFDAGYRNRQTAYRNFVKFMGCSPSEFIAKG